MSVRRLQAIVSGMVLGGVMPLAGIASAQSDAFMDEVHAEVEMYAGAQSDWRGPTAAPKPEPGKKIAYLSSNRPTTPRANGATPWSRSARRSAGRSPSSTAAAARTWLEGLNQAMALKVDGIITDADIASLQPR